MTVAPIPWSSVERWATRHGLTGLDDLCVLESHIRAMERALDEFQERREKIKSKGQVT